MCIISNAISKHMVMVNSSIKLGRISIMSRDVRKEPATPKEPKVNEILKSLVVR